MVRKLPLILPVETHVRELDGKLLLAAVAAENGRECFIGCQNEIRARIGSLPRGHFIAKGFASQKARFLSILKQLGFNTLAWDEEGLVHPEPKVYYKRRISAESLSYLQGVFSWGRDYSELFRAMPFYDGTQVYETGNPRLDLLDARVRGYFSEEAKQLQTRFGKFILLNSNFGRVNSAIKRSRDKGVSGKLSDPILDAKWQDMLDYRRKLYHQFRDMFDELCNAFPNHQVILRPHPSERIESWNDIQEKHKNAHVIYEGNVLPWLIATDILVHNGCTTALESTLLNRPVLAYMPITSDIHDWHLPNSVSHQVFELNDLVNKLQGHLNESKRLVITEGQRAELDFFVRYDTNALCSDAIVTVLDSLDLACQEQPNRWMAMKARFRAKLRAAEKSLRSWLPNDIYAQWHQDKHFPDFSVDEIQNRLKRLALASGRFDGIEVTRHSKKLFRIVPAKK